MKGLIIHNAYYLDRAYLYQAIRLQEEFGLLGVDVDVKTDDALLSVDGEGVQTPFAGYDFCVFWDKDLYLLQALQQAGVRVFNALDAVRLCDDKMLTFLALSQAGLPLPKTLASPLCYDGKSALAPQFLTKAESVLNYPMVVKRTVGSLGDGVYLASDRNKLEAAILALCPARYLLQEYVATSYGTDVRVLVLGGEIVGAIRRYSDGFLSNVAQGGKAEPYPLPKEAQEICLRAASVLGLDYCGVDLLMGANDRYWISEVNSNAFFETFEKTTGINVAQRFARYVLAKCAQNHKN